MQRDDLEGGDFERRNLSFHLVPGARVERAHSKLPAVRMRTI